MKTILFILSFLSIVQLAQASELTNPCLYWAGLGPCPYQAKTICGTTSREMILGKDQFNVFLKKGNQIKTELITVSSIQAQDFLSVLSLHGAKICNFMTSSDAPFKICFQVKGNNLVTNQISCGKKESCTGSNCGGNGISINSGSLN